MLAVHTSTTILKLQFKLQNDGPGAPQNHGRPGVPASAVSWSSPATGTQQARRVVVPGVPSPRSGQIAAFFPP